LAQANKRLATMMKHQFELRRGEKSRGSRGLDIDVYDYRTGKLRDVRTLSGGEAFVTSLAMAFGLSDIVQGSSGGTRIETMFIDEGFGTLDNEVLEQALCVLEELSQGNILIGIISHKEELRNRIANKLMVEKKDGKSTIRYQLE
jgi:exonuclease SbcC